MGLALLLCGLTFFAYLPAVHGGFIWDDTVLLTDSPLIKAPDGLYRFWFTTEAHDYWPLTSSTFWIEWRAWGMTSTGYHVTNVILHSAEALLLWAILTRLQIGGAFLAGLIFAVHPVNVESVAWISQRKNLVAMLFMQLATLSYLKAEDRRSIPNGPRPHAWYWLSLVMFALAMLGKGSAAVLPLILLLLTWWRARRLTRGDLGRSAPFLAIGGLLVLVNIWFQTHGVGGPIRNASLSERLLGAGAVVWFYLWKAFVPLHLAFVYPQWQIQAGALLWWIPILSALAVTACLWLNRETWSRPFFFAWAYFSIALLPVMGLTDVYFMKYSLVADHYQHLAMIGAVGLVAAGWSRWAQGSGQSLAAIAAAVLVGALTYLARQQSATYQNEEILYESTLTRNPRSWLAHHNLAIALSGEGRRQEAISHYEQALLSKPDLVEARVNLGLALKEEGRTNEAITRLEESSRLEPSSSRIQYNLGAVLAAAGRDAEAVTHYEKALQLRPDDPEAQNALGATLNALGRYEEATVHIQEALRLRPEYAEADANLGFALAQSGLTQQAIAGYEEALRIRPSDPEAHYNLASLLTDTGRNRDAIVHYEEALRLRPDYAVAHNNLAIALAREGRSDEALAHFRESIRLKPDFFDARMNLAETCTRVGRPAEGVREARAALQLARSTGQRTAEERVMAWLARHVHAGLD